MRKLTFLGAFVPVMALFFLAACGGAEVEPTAELVIPTAIAPVQSETPRLEAASPTPELPVPPTFQPANPAPDQPDILATAGPTPTPFLQVAFVTADDTLNVRSGPGVDNEVVSELAPDASGIQITGAGQLLSGSTWVPIAADAVAGWVNGRFLTGGVDSAAFCQDESVLELVEGVKTAVTNQDGEQLAQLIHPERGLRLRHSWWNPEVRLTQDEVRQIFASSVSHDWGVQDGSGKPIVGSFKQEILPLLQEDLLLAVETGCDEIIHGGTAGLVRLPDGYEAVHYYAYHRPGTDEFAGMDWGTWVVGVEQWQGAYYVSFLVHYQWEI